MKKTALLLAVLMLALVAWGIYVEGGTTRIIINGEELTGPFKGIVGVGGLVAASIALLCAAILLAFVFAGLGLFILGGVIVVGIVAAAVLFPLLLLLLIPLAIVWLFVAIAWATKS